MIRLAAAAMRRPMPSFAGPQKTDPLKETEMLYLLLADPVKRLDKERDGILLIEQHGPAFLASSRYWLIASFDTDSREGSKS